MPSAYNKVDNNVKHQPASKFPTMKVVAVAITAFTNYCSMQLVYPFIPFMVKDFFPQLQDSELGYRVGLLGASFNLGNFVGSILWGYIADIKGRRFALISGILGTLVSTLLFGFSVNYIWAIGARFLWGILNGNSGVSKVYLSEILTNEQQSVGFTTLGATDGLGRIVGPVIGGYLGHKGNIKYIADRIEMVKKFPYLIACLICVLFSVIGYIVAYSTIKETLTPELKERMKVKRNGDKNNTYSFFTVFKTWDIMIPCCLYAILGIHGSAFDETLPLFLLNPKSVGGFAYDSSKIGVVYLLAAPLQLFGLIFFYPKWTKWFGYRMGMVYSSIVGLTFTYFFPVLSIFNNQSVTFITICVSMVFGILQLFRIMCFTSVIVLINNSCLPEQKSKTNALAQTLSGACRSIGPYFGANLFAWSCNNNIGYPYNYTFLYKVISMIYVITIVGTYILPPSIENKKTLPTPTITVDKNMEVVVKQ